MIDFKDIIEGNSYACKFQIETMLDESGQPPGVPHFGSPVPGGVGLYKGFGVIMNRDFQQGLVKVRDQESLYQFVVPVSDIWDIDTVEWVDVESNTYTK